MSFPAIPAGYGVPLVNLATDLPPADMLDALDDRYAKGNTTTDAVSFWDGASDIVMWRKPGAPGSVVPTAGASFSLSNNKLYLRNGWLVGSIDWTRTSGSLTHADIILTLPVGARPDTWAFAVTSGLPSTSQIFNLSVSVAGDVAALTPPSGRTSGEIRFAMPVPYDYT